MKYRAMFSDKFIDVEAESENEAQEIAARILRERIQPLDFIVWQDDEATPDRTTADGDDV